MAEPADKSAEHRKRLLQLHAAFKQRLQAMLVTVQADWQAIRATTDWSQNAASRLQQIHHLVHRIRGSAGSFGYPHVSEAAAPLDDLLSELRGASPTSVLENLDQITALIESLAMAFEKNHAAPAIAQLNGIQLGPATKADPKRQD